MGRELERGSEEGLEEDCGRLTVEVAVLAADEDGGALLVPDVG
ncbi:protein of unknown function [Ruminococcaceae bacterium BL-6]|nr:protein of unknown function [Ruminococcaceae bacterium BL-6]